MSTPTTRTFCPLCDWYHDSDDPALTTPASGVPIKGSSLQDLIEGHVQQSLTAHYAALEVVIREHLETHPLIEWVTEVTRLQRELNKAVAVRGPATADDFPWWNRPGVLQAEELHLPPGPRLTGIVMDPGDVVEVDGDVALPIPVGTSAATANEAGPSVGADATGVRLWGEGSSGCGFPPVQARKASPAVQQLVREMFGAGPEGYRDYLRATYPVTLEELDAEPDPSALPNMEDCPLCVDPNPPYPWNCPGHPEAVAGPATRSEEKHGPQFRWILGDGDNDFGRWHDLEGDCDACCCGGVKECADCGGREHHEPIEKPGGGTMHDWVCQTCRETPGGDPAEVEER